LSYDRIIETDNDIIIVLATNTCVTCKYSNLSLEESKRCIACLTGKVSKYESDRNIKKSKKE